MSVPAAEPLREAFHMSVLKQHDPKLYALVGQVREHAMQEGAIPTRIKTLMAFLCDAVRDRHEAARVLAGVARAQGASEAEIAETLAVAYWIGGVHALNTGAEAFRE
jgi:alkylhydroperoxidase/carboxymuconolactone decarboxylase family protein YurZ